MAVVSPVLSTEWPFSSSIGPFDAPTYGLEFADHTPLVGHTSNKRRVRDAEWDTEDDAIRGDLRTKKAKTTVSSGASSSCLSVDPQQLQNDHTTTTPIVMSASGSHQAPLQQVLSILVDALTSTCKSSSSSTSASISASTPATVSSEPQQQIVLSSTTISEPLTPVTATTTRATATVPSQRQRPFFVRPRPTSPLSDCEDRAPYVRKIVGGACAGKIEPSLCRWVLIRNHFTDVRHLDPPTQPKEWLRQLKRLGWEHAHPYYQLKAQQEMLDAYGPIDPFANWVEDDFDYDGTDWSDEEEGEEGEIIEDRDPVHGQTGVWDSGVPLQLPYKV